MSGVPKTKRISGLPEALRMQKATVNLVMVCYNKSTGSSRKGGYGGECRNTGSSLCPSQQPPSAHRASGLELQVFTLPCSESDKHALETVLPILSFIFPWAVILE